VIGVLLLAAVGCDTAEESPPPMTAPVELVSLDAPRLLRRISLDLRGTLPTEAELDAVEADPAQLDTLAAEYLHDDHFEDRLVSMLAQRWHTVLDQYEVWATDYGLETQDSDRFAHSVGEEPLRLISHVVAENRPWSEIVTADYTMSNDLLAQLWPVEYPAGATGWQEARYTDGRPAAGVLATNGFYWRYVTNVSNKSRGRVAAISRLLLCTDMLGRPVQFKRNNTLDPEEAIKTEPGCITCHATVDPIAASMFGFWWTIQYNPWEMQTYHPERERLGPTLLDTDPGWYGTPTGGLVDMGWYISNDPRFNHCAAQSFAEQYWHRPSDVTDFETIDDLWAGFEASGTAPQELILKVLQTEQYKAGGFTADATAETHEREVVDRLLTPNQQRMAFNELTGLDWREINYDGLENDVFGYRILGGGVDGYSVTGAQASPGLTWVLVNKRFAQAAAEVLVERDLGAEAPAVLTVDEGARPGEAAFDEQLRRLCWRLFAIRADDAWVAETGALWTAVYALEGERSAWEGVVESMLRDPNFVSY
jgi:hypothetical protein